MNIAIIGTGYVGLGTGICLAELGHNVICVDRKQEIVDSLNDGKLPTYEPYLEESLRPSLDYGRIKATTDLYSAVLHTDISIICVGTPDKGGEQDLSEIEQVSKEIGKAIGDSLNYHVVVVKSTVLPTTTDTLVKNTLEKYSNKKVGEFGLAMNPEFLRQGTAYKDFMYPGRIIIGGYDKRSTDMLLRMYKVFDCDKLTMNPRTAEMIKYACNSFLATMISFSNEFANICECFEGVDVINVLKGLRSDYKFRVDGKEPVANSYLWPGCGYGGSCFPKDVQAIRSYAKSFGLPVQLLESTIEINEIQPFILLDRIKRLKPKRVCILGLSYKPDTDDIRESPAIKFIDYLSCEGGIEIVCHDPQAMENAKKVVLDSVKFANTKKEAMKDADMVIVVTPWKEYRNLDFKCKYLVDARRIYNKEEIEKKGIKYIGVGVC